MLDTVGVLAIAAVLSSLTVVTFALRVMRADPSQPERLIGELRLAQWAAVLLAGVGAIPIGLAAAAASSPLGAADAALGVIFVGWAGIVLQRDPREALLFVAAGFIVHALVSLAHRPGWLDSNLVPHWFIVGVTIYDVGLAGVCYWARRR